MNEQQRREAHKAQILAFYTVLADALHTTEKAAGEVSVGAELFAIEMVASMMRRRCRDLQLEKEWVKQIQRDASRAGGEAYEATEGPKLRAFMRNDAHRVEGNNIGIIYDRNLRPEDTFTEKEKADAAQAAVDAINRTRNHT